MQCMEAAGSQAGHSTLGYVCLSCAEVEKVVKANRFREQLLFSAQCQIQRVVLVLTDVFNTTYHNYMG